MISPKQEFAAAFVQDEVPQHYFKASNDLIIIKFGDDISYFDQTRCAKLTGNTVIKDK